MFTLDVAVAEIEGGPRLISPAPKTPFGKLSFMKPIIERRRCQMVVAAADVAAEQIVGVDDRKSDVPTVVAV